jgi:transglutaminase-like putative cysteine protease
MLYRVQHTTRYLYEGPVSYCVSEARLAPRVCPGQNLREFNLRVEPRPVAVEDRLDYFGNPVTTFTILQPHDRLTVTASSLVELEAPARTGPSPSWECVREKLSQPVTEAQIAASEFRWASPHVPWMEDLLRYGSGIFTPRRPIAEAADALMRRIYRDFRYTPKATSIETPLNEVLASRHGVCQDFAHVMIGVLRANGLAARYVSGYLRSDAGFEGAQASHAWVSVWVPFGDGGAWTDFDPTNNVQPGGGHLTLSWGRDFADVSPIKGVTVGGGDHRVDVDVRVAPVTRQ